MPYNIESSVEPQALRVHEASFTKKATLEAERPSAIALFDLRIEGLENERAKFIEGVEAYGEGASLQSVEEATKAYTLAIEESLNQPIEVVLQNANVTQVNDIVIAYRDAGAQATARMKEGATGKTLTEKPKSSKHGIALSGYIPIEQSFGKAGDSGQAERFNKIVDERFKKGQKYVDQLDQIVIDLNSGAITEKPAELNEILEHYPVARTVVTDKEGREIYGLVDDKGLAIRDAEGKPSFAYKNERGEYCNEVDGSAIEIPNNTSFKKIEALSYISGIERGSDGQYKLTTQKITGDHDQLAIGTKGIRGDKIDDKEITATKGFADDHGLAVTLALIDETKKTGAVRHGQDAGGAGTKGSLSEDNLALIAELAVSAPKDISEFLHNDQIKTIMDAKLSGNPYPEDFAKGNYAFYYPDGKISVAHNEAEIVQKYNEAEAQGYNMGINPRYGWLRNQDGRLEIDPNKISAQAEIIANTKNQQAILEGPEFEALTPIDRVLKAESSKHDAEQLYELASLFSLIKLQEASPSKEQALSATKRMLRFSEANYIKEYQMVPPTVEAIVDPKQKLAVMTELKEIAKEIVLQRPEAEKKVVGRRASSVPIPTQEDPEVRERSGSEAPFKLERVSSAQRFDEKPSIRDVYKKRQSSAVAGAPYGVGNQAKGRVAMSQ